MQLSSGDFLPTPVKLVKKMIAGLEVNYNHSILEPSAGKGDLIEAFIENNKSRYCRFELGRADLDAVEIDPEQRHILTDKGIRVVHDDFLTFNTLKRYNWILMNPPFSCGDRHLTKALEFLKEGGTCVCLLDRETLENPNSHLRKALLRRLKEWKYKSQIVRGAFKKAGQKTSVDAVIVRVTKPEFDEKTRLHSGEPEVNTLAELHELHAPIDGGSIHKAVRRCREEQKLMLRILELHKIARPLLQKILPSQEDEESRNMFLSDSPILEFKILPNEYIEQIRVKYWRALFGNPAFTGQLTSHLKCDFHNYVDEMRHYDFNGFNITAMQAEWNGKIQDKVQKTIFKLFDEFSRKHHWSDEPSQNVNIFKGWKTDKSWKLNKKMILSLRGVSESSWGRGYGHFDYEWRAKEKLCDIEKCLDYLGGNTPSQTSTSDFLNQAENRGQTKNIFLRHLQVTFYKKGTTHIEFLDPDLLERFNIYVARHINWLPPGYGKTKYEDMTDEERDVIDAFQGKEAYQKVCERNDLDHLEIPYLPQMNDCFL